MKSFVGMSEICGLVDESRELNFILVGDSGYLYTRLGRYQRPGLTCNGRIEDEYKA